MIGSIYSILRKLKRSNIPVLRPLINQAYYDPQMVILPLKTLDYVVVDDFKFHANDQIDSLQRVAGNPWFRNIRSTDIVLDIGANIGAVTIPLAKIAKMVYAVEPLFMAELSGNVVLNRLNNIQIIPFGMGNNGSAHVEFSSKAGDVPLVTFKDIVKGIGHIDFIKVDCEGYEWELEPTWFSGIREIRFEFHIRRGSVKEDRIKLLKWLSWLDANQYQTEITYGANPGPCVPFKECVLVNASRDGIR